MAVQLEIDSIFDYYDAPLNGVGHLGDQRLYYYWIDDAIIDHPQHGNMKIRQYCAFSLSADEWAIIERHYETAEAAVSSDGGDQEGGSIEATADGLSKLGKLHESLEHREGVVSFTSNSIPFPSYHD